MAGGAWESYPVVFPTRMSSQWASGREESKNVFRRPRPAY